MNPVPEPNEGPSRRCGFVGLIGRPNVGKSTLLNRLLGTKVSIVTRKPQTTRHRILGVRTRGHEQIIYVDTPGLHRREPRALNRLLNRSATSVLDDMDVLLFVTEALRWQDDDQFVLEKLSSVRTPVIAVVNMVDRVAEKSKLLPYLEALSQRREFTAMIPVSARRGTNLDALEGEIAAALPESEQFYFPEGQITDRPEQFLLAELVREQLMNTLGQEVPYSTTVSIEADRKENATRRIHAVIWVERPGQKAIVIGKGGRQLREIGRRARLGMESLLGEHVYLDLWVRVRGGWADDERTLRSLGYGEG